MGCDIHNPCFGAVGLYGRRRFCFMFGLKFKMDKIKFFNKVPFFYNEKEWVYDDRYMCINARDLDKYGRREWLMLRRNPDNTPDVDDDRLSLFTIVGGVTLWAMIEFGEMRAI